jgi:alkylated DNA repair dioxygenase AlkB
MDKFVTKKLREKVKKEQTEETIPLTKRSFVIFVKNAVECPKNEFDEFWDIHPLEHWEIMMFGKPIKIPRFQKLYGKTKFTYKFSGTSMPADPIVPDLVQKCFDFAIEKYPKLKWNGALVNWYADGSHYIGAHSDDEEDMVDHTPILSFSFGGIRTFRIKKKTDANDNEVEKMDFPTEDCCMIAMCGSMQKEYKHEITKTKKFVKPRINITVRCFN